MSSEILQVATLFSAIIGWATVIIGGVTIWSKVKLEITELKGKLDNLCGEYNSLKSAREECEKREQSTRSDHENRIRALELSK